MCMILLYCILFISLINAQIDTTLHLSYFPLHIGDKWQYEISDYNHPSLDTTFYEIYEVLGDTVMPNHKKYSYLNTQYWCQYLRIDTSELKVKCYAPYSSPDSELIYFDLHPLVNYPSNGGYTVQVDSGFGQVGLLPYSEYYYSYFWFDGFDRYFELSQNYGISYWNIWELLGFQGALIAAEINGIKYGQFVTLDGYNTIPHSELIVSNHPNPFNSSTIIEFSIPSPGLLELTIFNLQGKAIHKLRRYYPSQGTYNYTWDAINVGSGIYLIHLRHNLEISYKKCILIK